MASTRPLLLIVFLLFASLSAADPPKVGLSLYYETLCPYCSRFIVNHLSNIFSNGLISIVDLQLVPYGNAKIGPNGTITCQHGPYECLLNTVEACAISTWPDLSVHFKFIYCVEKMVVDHTYMQWKSCFQKLGPSSQNVLDCYSGAYGKKLELEYAAQTDALVPPHKYVPWVVVDGQPLYDDYEDFEIKVCEAYKGDLPKACRDLLKRTQGIIGEALIKSKAAENACYKDGIAKSAVM